MLYGLLLSCIIACTLHAQDLGNIGKEKFLKVNGGISANSIFYTSNDVNRRTPFSYYLNGNLNFSLYGWNIPVSFSYSNRTFGYMQPFNQFSLHPTYKWATAHVGWSSMSFSPYTLNGHQFFGLGLELAPPGKWKYGVVYGRFQRAVQAPDSGMSSQSAYKRMGVGFKVAYDEKNYQLSFNLFRAKDDTTSLSHRPPDITPQENIALGFTAGVIIIKGLRFNMEYASSILTRDIRPADSNVTKNTGLLLGRNSSTNTSHAIKAGLSYTHGTFSMGLGYERIDPQYRTLGAYYNNNDYQNATVNFTQSLFKQKVVLSANAGVQQDDLDHKKISNMRRLVTGASLAYQPTEHLQVDASYSNFQSYTNIKSQFTSINQVTPYDNLDTLNYTQISQSANLNLSYQIGNSKKLRQMVNVNLSVQDAAEQQNEKTNVEGGSRFYNAIAGYNLSLVPSSTTFALGLNVSFNDSYASEALTWGPMLAFNRPLWHKRVKISSSLAYNTSTSNGKTVMDLYNFRIGAGYSLFKKHVFSLSLLSLLRHNHQQMATTTPARLKEFTATAGYSYSF
jgi:hypothetical protein